MQVNSDDRLDYSRQRGRYKGDVRVEASSSLGLGMMGADRQTVVGVRDRQDWISKEGDLVEEVSRFQWKEDRLRSDDYP